MFNVTKRRLLFFGLIAAALVSVVAVLGNILFTQSFTGQIGDHVTVGFTTYDLGTVLANQTISDRVPATGWAFTTNDYAGSFTLTLDFQGCSGNFTRFNVQIWRDNAPDLLIDTLTLTTLSTTLTVSTNENYYYILDAEVSATPTSGVNLEIKITGEV